MNFEAVIGLEIHVQQKTKSKMFSSAPNSFSRDPNTQVAPLDMAFPGTMPVVNKQAVINAIRVANALHMEIDHTLYFDRKNYFYSDLPKGFQITQQRRPIGKNGYVMVDTPNGKKRIGIERIHMEEDTCKQEHFMDYSLLDYNRAGVPLCEIVSLPEISNGVEAREYAEAIRNIVVYSGTSDGKMEEGSMRCDTNISLRPYGQKEFGTKVEIKNINSFKNIELAIEYEMKRQSQLLLQGIKIQQETRRWDEASGKTVLMRVKTDAVDYKYFCEPNITPIHLSDEFVQDAIDTCPELYDSKKERYLKAGLSDADANVILANPKMAAYFEEGLAKVSNAKDLANFLIVEINSYLNKNEIAIENLKLSPLTLGEIVSYQEKGGLSHKQCTDILNKVLEEGCSPEEAKNALHIVAQVSDSSVIMGFVTEVLDKNPQSIQDFKNGNQRVLGFLVGQIMKASHGKVNPAEVSKTLRQELDKR
ncbi:MAG: Asp-tRNA(Asn)/Glu-tRNA(Gln) amidotransferase subunit GatB [Mollicutes bacterium]|nr:Asp-tRNA(Asn)/Glu-tRNA(Gln) amidotransferase subunit GatB [Mollicutes bacterium]MDD7043595.1 Asp-tRNA(Asn)/Glu-tRNA(Gln) amidotransferase subunit GatB [Mollicutes bacterium]MDY6070888.1 Asp-tRNA(Asn)/Glu-tRNA(Gln) amidotransferase subunit GatB [Bacilli bacterium]